MGFLTEFWTEKYLKEYIKEGGSKIKFVTGRKGSGKTFFLENFSQIARELNYITVTFSAKEIWLHDFREIYLEIFRQSNLLSILHGCGEQLIEKMGYHKEDIPEGQTFMDYLASKGMGDALTKREIRVQLKEMFLDNPLLDNNFALACSFLTGSILGHPILEPQNQELLLSWMNGDKTVKLPLLRSLGLSPSKITKYNARHMLRSLAEIIHQSGYSGLLVVIDDMEILQSRSSLSPLRYTKMRREDTYESLRQLIDEIDSLKNIMFLLGFRRELLDDDNTGIKSYQALWMRIQNEIIGRRFNCFSDIADLDQAARQAYKAQDLVDLSQEMAKAYPSPLSSISLETAKSILEREQTGGMGIPGLVMEELSGGTEDKEIGGGDNV